MIHIGVQTYGRCNSGLYWLCFNVHRNRCSIDKMADDIWNWGYQLYDHWRDQLERINNKSRGSTSLPERSRDWNGQLCPDESHMH